MLHVTDSGDFDQSDIDPFNWSLSIGDLKLDSGSLSASFLVDELNDRLENIVDTCDDSNSFCDDLRFQEKETENLLSKSFGKVPGADITKSYAKGSTIF